MATGTITQDHSAAVTVTKVSPNSKQRITLSGGGARGIILVGGTTENHFPFVSGFRFNDAGTSFFHRESPSGSSTITIAKSSAGSSVIDITSTSSVTTPIVIFMENRSVSSLESIASS